MLDKKRMKCNSPRRSPSKNKKFVVKACENGKEKIIHFGDPICVSRKTTQQEENLSEQDILATLKYLR